MANWYNSTNNFPFTKSTFLTWWNTSSNYNAVGKGVITSPTEYTSATSTGQTITLGGTSYTIYKLKKHTVMLSPDPHFAFFKTNDGCRGTQISNYKIKNQFGSGVNAKFDTNFNDGSDYYARAIKLKYPGDNKEYYYLIGREVDQTANKYDETSHVDPFPSSFEPYQTVVFTNTPSITVAKTQYVFNSNSLSSSVIETKTLYPSWSSYYTSTGTKLGYASYESGSGSFSLSINISDWANKNYEIVATGSAFSLYTGKEVGQDFLSAYKIQYTKSNSYGSEVTYPKTALELNKMSKTIISENDENFAFEYDISDITETSTTSLTSPTFTNIHRLASGNNKFKNVVRQTTFALNDVISALDVPNAGSLTYDDDTTISLKDVTISSYSTVASFGALPHTVSFDTPSIFTLTYTIVTTYFGEISLTDKCYTEESAQVGSVGFYNYQVTFTPNQVIGFGNNAYLEVRNKQDEVVKTITSENIGSYAVNLDSKYGKYASEYLVDGGIRLTFQAYGVQLEQWIYMTYDEPVLKLNTNSVKLRYIFDPKDGEFDFDYTELVITATRHTNTPSGTTIVDRTLSLNSVSISHETIDIQKGKEYGITVSYTNEWGQILTGTFTIYAEPLAPQRIMVTGGAQTSARYYDNGSEIFKLPIDIELTVVFNDPTYNTVIEDLSDLEFYRDEQHSIALAVSSSVISRADGNSIYFHSKTYNVDGSYNIVWLEDTIQSVTLASPINVFLGNKLNKQSVKSQVTLNCLHASGITSVVNNPNDFNFTLTSIVLDEPTKEQCTVVLSNVGTFEISNYTTYFVWHKPYAVMSFDLTNFQTAYNNGVDVIHPDGIIAIVSYYEDQNHTIKCDYEQICEYSSEETSLYNKFTITGLDDLQNYGFGTQVLNITMSGVSQSDEHIQVTANNRFYSSGSEASVSNIITVSVIEILDITGIKILNAKTEYNVGDTFLNENDNTKIMIFYNDAQKAPRTYTCFLKSGLTALNIYPLKGTKFEQITQNKVVTITSATNYNVSVQYSIDVKANYIYDDTAKHNLVALFIDNYGCPDRVTRSKYYLVERAVNINGDMVEMTKIDPMTGERVIADGFDQDDLNVFGYLEDIGDPSMNARVILFRDYISPIEGSNNITVKFPCYVEGNADLINKCHFGIMFGNNNSKNRLFLSGNADFKNKDWHSGQVDSTYTSDEGMLNGNYGYFEDLSECIYGETDNAVVGYDIVANDKLLVLKDYSDKETTVYFRQPQLVTAINTGGTAVTGLDDETLYQEEFSLSKGNNSVAGVNPRAVVNFNGDCLFISHDKEVVGLDLTGIIGDNQRYANSRSYYIDEELKNHDLSKAFLWSNNKYLFLVLDTKIYVSHFETKHDNQYEWFVMDVAGVSSVLEKDGIIYLGKKDGTLFKFSDIYKDAKKVFAGYGITRLSANEQTELITASEYLSELDPSKSYLFRPIPFTDMGADDDPYIYYSLGSIRNDRTLDCDFYVNNSDNRNVIELVCNRNGLTDVKVRELLLKRISELDPVYLNKIDSTESDIVCQSGSIFEKAHGKKFYLREYTGEADKHLYQLIDENGDVMPVKELYRARLCMRITRETEMANIDVKNGTFQLKMDGEIIDIVQYSSQSLVTAFRGEIIEYSNVEAFYITKPYVMGNLEYLKTIWSFTLTNDTNIPSELELCYATNKIPYEAMKTLASISKDTLGFDISNFNFSKVDFDKNIVPRTYTHKRILSGVKFVCFGFRNYKDSNSVLSSMTVTYTVPYPSYSGD